MTSTKPLCFKTILIGDTEVGKSALQMSFIEGRYGRTEMTLGVEFSCKECTVKGRKVRCEIWDTAGQETYLSVTRTYYRNAHCCVLCFDMTRRESFDNVGHWLSEARQNTGNEDLVVILVGTKSDLEGQRDVPRTDAEVFDEHQTPSCAEGSSPQPQPRPRRRADEAHPHGRPHDAPSIGGHGWPARAPL